MNAWKKRITVVASVTLMVFAVPALAGKGACAKGRGHHGKSGGPGTRVLKTFDLLDLLASETAPVNFTVDSFPDADADSNGVLSDAEWVAFAETTQEKIIDRLLERFPTLDADTNGEVGEAELAAFEVERIAEFRERLLERHPEVDVDGDGAISDAEFDAHRAERLAGMIERVPAADLDNDGVLTAQELAAFHLAKRANMDGKRGGRRGFHRRGMGRHANVEAE